MTASHSLVPAPHRSGMPIARMRSLYRTDEVGRKLPDDLAAAIEVREQRTLS